MRSNLDIVQINFHSRSIFYLAIYRYIFMAGDDIFPILMRSAYT